jgi:serine/threonine-protein kinase RsbW
MSSARIVLVNQRREITRLSAFIDRFGLDQGLSTDETLDINLVLDEVVLNIIRHGYDDEAEHQILVRLTLEGAVLTMVVEDDGREFNPLEHPAPNLDLPIEERGIGGLGVHIVRTLTKSLEHRRVEGRNVLTMQMQVAPGHTPPPPSPQP